MESNSALKKSLLLIPDISGFTRFVNETEIVHGVHIISELLELIIKNNTLGLQVAEIEGDAVLFYKYTEKPSLEDIYDQCSKMFLAFHQHIKLYERDRICDCGSCSSTPDLTLKFVVHYGDVVERNILGHFQLMGADVTTAHKLMKNNIDADEYILISENSFKETDGDKLPSWFKLEQNTVNYKDVGNVSYHYEKLTELLKNVPEIPKRELNFNAPVQVTLNWDIQHDINTAFDFISSLERKQEWIKGVDVVFDKTKVERVGTKHECITPLNTLKIETTKNEGNKNEMVFGEMTQAVGIFPATNQTFTVKSTGANSCTLSLEIQFKNGFFNSLIYKPLIKKGISKGIKNLIDLLDRNGYSSIS